MSTVQSVSVDRARLNNAVHDGHGMRISQSTFDEVVRENVDDFGMEMAEACADAVAQFEAQGVDLSNICCEPGAAAADAGGADGAAEGETGAPAEDPPIIAVSKALVQSADDAPLEEVYATVQKLLVELAEGGKAPIVAGSHGAVQALVVALLRLLDASKADAADEGGDDDDNDDNADGVDDNKDGIAAASGAAAVPDADGAGEGARPLGRVMATVRAISLCMVVPYNREVLGEDGLGALLRVAEQHGANPTACGRSLLALARACVKDENNRQDLVERGAVPAVVDCLRRHGAAAEPTRAHHRAVRGACDATVALTLGDDPRAALTKSHEHIRLLAHEGAIEALCAIAHTAFVRELPTAAAVLSALSKIAARNDLCERIVALGGLDAVVALHAAHGGDAKFARAACALIKAVSGNDEARALICNGPALDVVLGTLSVHSEDAPACLGT
jgi:hypothetical protein